LLRVAAVAVVVAAVAVAVEAGVSAAAVAVVVEAAEVSAEVAGVAGVPAGAHQVLVHRVEAVLGASGTRAVGLRLPEALAGAAAVVATIAEAGPERGTEAVLRVSEAGGRKLAERRKADVRTLAERNKAGGRINAGRIKAIVRINGQSSRTNAQTVVTSVAMM
jgi:hypothetical protein